MVVVSAMGKTTNKLLAIADAAVGGQARASTSAQLARSARLSFAGSAAGRAAGDRAELDRTLDEHFQELTELVKGLAVLGELTPRVDRRDFELMASGFPASS